VKPKIPVLNDEDDDAWIRQYTMPEEYIIACCHPTARNNYWRWFKSPNVIDLVRIRRQRKRDGTERVKR
jgi:hypothetical protein